MLWLGGRGPVNSRGTNFLMLAWLSPRLLVGSLNMSVFNLHSSTVILLITNILAIISSLPSPPLSYPPRLLHAPVTVRSVLMSSRLLAVLLVVSYTPAYHISASSSSLTSYSPHLSRQLTAVFDTQSSTNHITKLGNTLSSSPPLSSAPSHLPAVPPLSELR